MRRLVGTSWKMHLTATDAARYCEMLLPLVGDVDGVDMFILPPFTAIWAVRDRLRGSPIAWGAQAVHPEDAGAHTGDISAPMLADLGCSYTAVGHAERRRDHGETDESVAAQIRAVQRWDMTAILCVGERTHGTLDDAMAQSAPQLQAAVGARSDRLIVAYEPTWAIGTGAAAADPAWISEVHGAIRGWLATHLDGGGEVPVIYGGSVDSSSAGGILERGRTDGLFVGRSALDPTEFSRIAHLAMPARDARR